MAVDVFCREGGNPVPNVDYKDIYHEHFDKVLFSDGIGLRLFSVSNVLHLEELSK
jgi:hypothetical protein